MSKVDTAWVTSNMFGRYSVSEVEQVPHADLQQDAVWCSWFPTRDSPCDVQAVRVCIYMGAHTVGGLTTAKRSPLFSPRRGGVGSASR